MSCQDALAKPRPVTPPGLPLLLVAAAALIDEGGRVLVTQRPQGKSMAGLWEFPGGKIEPGETPEFTLTRELAEELGIESRAGCFTPAGFASHPYETMHLLMPLYVLRMWRGTPQGREGQALQWVRPTALYDLPMPPADLPLIPQLLDRL